MNGRKFRRSLSALILGSGSQLASNVAAAVLTTLLLPVDQRGLVVLAVTIAAIASAVGGLGVGNGLRALLPTASARMRQHLLRAAVVTIVVLATVTGAVAAAVMYAIAPSVDNRLGEGAFPLATGALAAQAVVGLILTEIRFADGRFISGARWGAAVAVAGLFGQITGVAVSDKAAFVVLCNAVAISIAVALSAAFEARHGPAGSPPAAFRMRLALALIARGVRMLALPLGIVLLTRADRLVLGFYQGPESVAVYALALTVVEVARLVPTAVGQIVAREISVGATSRLVRARLMSAAAATLGAVLAIVLLASALIPEVFGERYRGAITLMWILAVSESLYALLVISNLGLIGGNWSKQARRIAAWVVPGGLVVFVMGAATAGALGLASSKSLWFVVAGFSAATVLLILLRRRGDL